MGGWGRMETDCWRASLRLELLYSGLKGSSPPPGVLLDLLFTEGKL